MGILIKELYTEQVYQLLRTDIVNQSIACGQKLNIRELGRKYDVSGSPIREAISRLHQEGLVEYIPNVGTRVINLGPKDIIELQNICILLDCGAMRLAMMRESPKIIAAELLQYIVKQQEASYRESAHIANQFHKVFYHFANNHRLQKIAQQIGGQIEILRTLYESQLKSKEDIGLKEHINIYEAVLLGDTENVVALITEHHKNVLNLLLEAIK
jgi:DNA-binding GntR family transcriptional regulator